VKISELSGFHRKCVTSWPRPRHGRQKVTIPSIISFVLKINHGINRAKKCDISWMLQKLPGKQKVAFGGAISIHRWQTNFSFATVYICTPR
jgi:hypothetical protein